MASELEMQECEEALEEARSERDRLLVKHAECDIALRADAETKRRLLKRAEGAEANYRFMVEKAADKSLDGYRELAAKCAALHTRAIDAEAKLAAVRAEERERAAKLLDAEAAQRQADYDSLDPVVKPGAWLLSRLAEAYRDAAAKVRKEV